MKRTTALLILLLFSCSKQKNSATQTNDAFAPTDTLQMVQPAAPEPAAARVYANERFREVTAEKVGGNKYRVTGKAQIFEAAFSWVVEDGHNELKKGFEMTDAGAPEWGQFDFTVVVGKETPNTTLTLVLFEVSADDGSRRHELPLALP